MTLRNIISNYKNNGNDFIFIRMDTLIERLRRMRALNSTPANIGITQYTRKNCDLGKRHFSKKG